ncbi:hypothetical protein FSP39_002131 [Pinctada imbricata]|uniref:Uncharacterized protein n=1 Tax=Pinctada imbricata TaxID=66713 RepID=A0AA89BY94_PINIB|nr:hypothetical protein FSP39_002131 [Pinctada imbricata]
MIESFISWLTEEQEVQHTNSVEFTNHNVHDSADEFIRERQLHHEFFNVRSAKTLMTLFLLIRPTFEYPNFKNFLPNGDKVQNPCKLGSIWKGVGHRKPEGGGPRNPFGLLFQRYKKWTSRVCDQDSDNDGITNGEELGDPYCEWSMGKAPLRTHNITHPGICEPMDSAHCRKQNAWLECNEGEQSEDCKALSSSGVRRKSLRFPLTTIPAQETSYYCQILVFPQDNDYHIIGTRPLIDNKDITHHILLFGCNEKKGPVGVTSQPYRCGMLAHRYCNEIIGTWTIGSKGDCYHDNEGFRIGLRGFRKAALQVHWNNPNLYENQKDRSGLQIYFTPYLRRHDAGMLLVGQEYLEIPPGKKSVRFDSLCSSECTHHLLKGPVHITRAINHMHYLGMKQEIAIYRNGSLMKKLTDESSYDYDSPLIKSFNPAVLMEPGDEIRTTCVFSSINKTKTVYFGDGTNDEMCYGFLNYHPAKNIQFPHCTTWKSVEKCIRYVPEFKGKYGDCEWYNFITFNSNQSRGFVDSINRTCSENEDTCSNACAKELNKFREHSCMAGDLGEFIRFRWKYQYLPLYPEMQKALSSTFSKQKQQFVLRVFVQPSNASKHFYDFFVLSALLFVALLS